MADIEMKIVRLRLFRCEPEDGEFGRDVAHCVQSEKETLRLPLVKRFFRYVFDSGKTQVAVLDKECFKSFALGHKSAVIRSL